MNTERFFEAMAFKLSLDQKKLDDKLERVVNSKLSLEDKLIKFESILQKMVDLEGLVTKFNEVIQTTNNNNKDADLSAK
jgi:hypothetical protein